MQPVILVHGLWHGSWCWSLLTPELAARDVASVAVDLDGHGLRGLWPAAARARPFDPARFATEPSPAADITASSAAATLVEQIRRIGGGRPCVVVAHSMGGIVATAAAELEPSLFADLVYVAAFAPVAGQPAAAYIPLPENEGALVTRLFAADPAVVGALRIDAAGSGPEVRETFYHDVDPALADAAAALLMPDGPGGLSLETPAISRDRFGAVPHTYVVCTADRTVPVALQRRFVRELDEVSAAPTRVVELDAGHSPFLSQPAALAEVIAATAAGS